MSFHLPFGNPTDSELLSFISEHDITRFSQYSHLVFLPLISLDDHDEVYNPDGQIDMYNANFMCHYFHHNNVNLQKKVHRRHQIHA